MTDITEDCSTCRHHTRQERIYPGFNPEGEKDSSLDVKKPVYVCLSPQGSHSNRDLLTPIRCEAYSPGQKADVPIELSQRMEAAMARMRR